MIHACAQWMRRTWSRHLLKGRCVAGAGTVVFSPRLIASVDGDPTKIAIGNDSFIRGEMIALPGGVLRVGNGCYLGEHSRVWAFERIEIGNHVLIAHNVSIFDSMTHPMDARERRVHFRAIVTVGHPRASNLGAKPVTIEDDVWIGCQSVVLRGVRIGRGSIVGAGSVVTQDIPAGVLAAGNPARVIRALESADRVSAPHELQAP